MKPSRVTCVTHVLWIGNETLRRTHDSKTPHLEEYSFLVAGALALAMVSWTSTFKTSITALGPEWAIPTTSRALVGDARSCSGAGTVSLAWSESPKGTDTRGELTPRTKSGRARMGLWEGDGHCSPLFCIVLPESALLAETRTAWHSATGGRRHLCPESSGNSGRTRAGTGMTLEKQKGPLPLCQTDPKSGILFDGSTSILPAWVSVLTESRPRGSVSPERELPSRTGTCTGTKEKTARKPVQGARPWTSLTVYVGHNCHVVRPAYDTMPPEDGRKYIKARKTALSSRQFMCQERNSPVHSPLCLRRPLPSPSLMRPSWPYGDGESHLTPLRRKAGSRHCKRGREQPCDTLIRRVAGTVGCNLSSFIHQSYFSQKFNKHQRRYSTIEKEGLALVLALQHFDVYVGSVSYPLIVYTDHNPLVFLNQMKNNNQRLMRWSLFLQTFELDIRHIRGKDNVIADALSRV